MVQHLPQAPLLGGIPVQRPLLRDSRKKLQRLIKLALDGKDRIVALHLLNVSLIKMRSFRILGSTNHV
jgi:hypothetical protein